MATTPPPVFRVHVIDDATVVDRGEQVRVWFLPFNDSWIRAHEHPAADVEANSSEKDAESCPPGTVWIRHVELLLPGGSYLLSRVTRPLAEDLTPLEYLQKGKLGTRRHVSEAYFRVAGNYRIVAVSEVPKDRLPAFPKEKPERRPRGT